MRSGIGKLTPYQMLAAIVFLYCAGMDSSHADEIKTADGHFIVQSSEPDNDWKIVLFPDNKVPLCHKIVSLLVPKKAEKPSGCDVDLSGHDAGIRRVQWQASEVDGNEAAIEHLYTFVEQWADSFAQVYLGPKHPELRSSRAPTYYNWIGPVFWKDYGINVLEQFRNGTAKIERYDLKVTPDSSGTHRILRATIVEPSEASAQSWVVPRCRSRGFPPVSLLADPVNESDLARDLDGFQTDLIEYGGKTYAASFGDRSVTVSNVLFGKIGSTPIAALEGLCNIYIDYKR